MGAINTGKDVIVALQDIVGGGILGYKRRDE